MLRWSRLCLPAIVGFLIVAFAGNASAMELVPRDLLVAGCPPEGDAGDQWESAEPVPRPIECTGSLGWVLGDGQDWYRTSDISASQPLVLNLDYRICVIDVNHDFTDVSWSVGFRDVLDAGGPNTVDLGHVGEGECASGTATRSPFGDAPPGEWYIRLQRSGCTCAIINYQIELG